MSELMANVAQMSSFPCITSPVLCLKRLCMVNAEGHIVFLKLYSQLQRPFAVSYLRLSIRWRVQTYSSLLYHTMEVHF